MQIENEEKEKKKGRREEKRKKGRKGRSNKRCFEGKIKSDEKKELTAEIIAANH
jgi:hypothetical protein